MNSDIVIKSFTRIVAQVFVRIEDADYNSCQCSCVLVQLGTGLFLSRGIRLKPSNLEDKRYLEVALY